MSTDGHFVFQHRNPATGEWSIINEIEFIPRNYLLYYALGNDQCATCPRLWQSRRRLYQGPTACCHRTA